MSELEENNNSNNPYNTATKWLKDLGLYIGTATATLIAIAEYQQKLTDFFQVHLKLGLGLGLVVAWLILLAPVLLVLLCRTLPAMLKKRNDNRLMQEGIKGELRYPDYFRLTPFEAEDNNIFSRADGVHSKIVDWVKESQQPLLYLTGRSGVGKSSIVQAWLIPQLQHCEPKYLILPIRTFNDPCKALLSALTNAKIWQRMPQESDLYALLEKACQKIAPQKLLIVLDQFEEFLILHEQEQRLAFTTLLQKLVEKPLPNLTLLTIFRSDYNGMIAELALPLLKQKENWQEVLPFTEAAARKFVKASGLELDDSLLEAILRELSELEDTAGLIRPISLNMVGLVIGRFAGGRLRDVEVGQLIKSYLQECLRHKEVADYAAKLLEPMITAHGTKKPMPLNALAVHCGCEVAVVRGVLLRLLQQGLVRPVGEETWEIAHDFAASQLGQLLPRLPKPVQWAGWVMGVGFVVWVAVFTVGKDLVAMSAQKNLADAHISVSELKNGKGYEIIISNREEVDFSPFWQQFNLLQLRKPILELRIFNNNFLRSLPALDELAQLEELSIAYNNKLQILSTLDKLSHLRHLTIKDNSILQSLSTLDKLPQLQHLEIDNPKFLTLNKLSSLRKLTINSTLSSQSFSLAKNGLFNLKIIEIRMPSLTIDEHGNLVDSAYRDFTSFITLPNLRFVCILDFDEKQWQEAEKFVQQRQAANMPAVQILKVTNDDECKL